MAIRQYVVTDKTSSMVGKFPVMTLLTGGIRLVLMDANEASSWINRGIIQKTPISPEYDRSVLVWASVKMLKYNNLLGSAPIVEEPVLTINE